MSYAPIAYTIPQYEDYKEWWMKAYAQGTTTPKVMATDAAAGTTAAKFEISDAGFPITAGSALVIPFIDGAYDLWLFPTAAEADADDTSNAIQIADNLGGGVDAATLAATDSTVLVGGATAESIGRTPQRYTLAQAKASATLQAGMACIITDRDNGVFDVVSGVSGADTYGTIANDAGTLKLVLSDTEDSTPKMYGASPAASETVNAGAINAWLASTSDFRTGSAGTYTVNATLTSGVADRWFNGNGMKIIAGETLHTKLLDITASGQTIERMQFEADTLAQCTGIFVGAYDDTNIRFCKFKDFDGSGGTDTGSAIVCNSVGKDQWIAFNRFENCHFSHGADQYGSVHCNAGGSVVAFNHIKDAQQTCVSVAGGSSGLANHIQVLFNTMVGATAATASGGFNFDGYTVGSTAIGNNIRDMAVEGGLIAGSVASYGTATSDFTMMLNTFHECVLNEFALQGNAGGDLVRGMVGLNKGYRSTNTNQSIVCTYVDHLDILGNQMWGHDSGVIVTGTSNHHNVSCNSFINQTNTGISASATGSIYANNRLYGVLSTTIGISFNAATTAGKMSIHGNSLRNCAKGIRGTYSSAAQVYVYDNNHGGNTLDLDYTNEEADSSRDNTSDTNLAGEATLVGGTVTVTSAAAARIAAGDRLEFELKTVGGTRGALYVNGITAGVGFTINSTSGTDTSTIYWRINR